MTPFSQKVQDSNFGLVENDGAVSTTDNDTSGAGVLSGKYELKFLIVSLDVTITYRERDTTTTSST